jgi:hypothetical protein
LRPPGRKAHENAAAWIGGKIIGCR